MACGVLVMLSGCAGLPNNVERVPSNALENTAETRLGRALAPAATTNPGRTGVYPLVDARDAFAARMLLARAAQRSLDVQYYIWHETTRPDNCSPRLLGGRRTRRSRAHAARRCEHRGPRRARSSALDAHPNIEVRLFNPFPSRHSALGDFVTDFARLNRRMHNKSFTADNQATIVGGRNVGNEYFGADLQVGFADLDVLAIGPVVRRSRPVRRILEQRAPIRSPAWCARRRCPMPASCCAAVGPGQPAARDAGLPAGGARNVRRARPARRQAGVHWSPARLVNDDPSKITAPSDRTDVRCCRAWRRRWAARRGSSTSCRHTSCRAREARKAWSNWPARRQRCAC